DAWIRYVSGGATAYRVIYLRRGSDVFLYRAGEHRIEETVVAPGPRDFATAYAAAADNPDPEPDCRAAARDRMPHRALGESFLYNYKERFIQHALAARRLIPHREVVLVAPYVSFSLLAQTAPFGRIVDDWLGDGSVVTLMAL